MAKIIAVLVPGLIWLARINNLSYWVIFHQLIFFLGFLVFLLIVISFFIGFAGGWFLARSKELLPLKLTTKDRLLVITPHPDDEVLALGGLLAWAKKRKIKLKIVFLTNGDANPVEFWQEKKVRHSPELFLKMGQRRMKEAKEALRKLGLTKGDWLFLGYPDQKIAQLFRDQNQLVAGGPRTTTNPYSQLANYQREYRGKNLIADLKAIINQFQPTKIFFPHLRDSNQDHRSAALFVRQLINQLGWSGEAYQYLIHFRWLRWWRVYPGRNPRKVIYPPRALWHQGDWFSFWLSSEEREKKKRALACYRSQKAIPPLNHLFSSFLAQNEIFQRLID